ncbi:MAG: hypothetical protein AAF458_17715 [Pseudomonadota bacterium]
MNKVIVVLFGVLTLTSVYMTTRNIGVLEPTVQRADLRDGSARGGRTYVGGSRRIK